MRPRIREIQPHIDAGHRHTLGVRIGTRQSCEWRRRGGLTCSFLYAGARTIVASLWQVDDRATSELMSAF